MFHSLASWIAGDLSREARIWTALFPALVGTVYFIGGLLIFAIRCGFKGVVPQDAETLQRGSTALVGMFLRHYFFWVIQPLWWLIDRSGLPANAFTLLATLLAGASGIAVAAGRFALGGWLFLASGILDTLDGRVARLRKTAGPAGAALDSVLDRYADSLLLMGLAWYFRGSWVLLAVLAAFLGTSVVPYVRARGEGLGVELRGGLMQRLERVLFLGGGIALSPVLEATFFPDDPRPMHWLAVAGLLFVAVMSNLTALNRLISLLRALSPRHSEKRRGTFSLLALNGLAALIATGADFTFVIALVEGAGMHPALATALGCVLGGGVNYGLNRVLTFRSTASVAPQVLRYVVVSATSVLLNASGVALLHDFPAIPYAAAWWLARGVVWLSWNLPLQREYVFGDPLNRPRQPSA